MVTVELSEQELLIIEDALDAYISNYASKSSSFVYNFCVELHEKMKRAHEASVRHE